MRILNRRTLAWTIVALYSPTLVACGASEEEPVSGQALALTAQQNVERALRGVHDAGSFVADSSSLATLLNSFAEPNCAPTAAPCAPGQPCADVEPLCEDAVTTAELDEFRSDLGEGIDELVQFLRDDVFIPENLEAEDGSSATYRLPPELFCGSDAPEAAPADPPPGALVPPAEPDVEVEDDCLEQAERLQVRLRLSSPRDGDGDVDVAVLLTAQKRNPATLQLREDRIAAVFDLGELKASLDALDAELEGLAAMQGKVSAELRRNAARDYSLRYSVLNEVGITLVDDLRQETQVSVGRSEPGVELRLDGNTRRVTGTYDYGTLRIQGPLNAFRDVFDQEEYDALGEPIPRTSYTGDIDFSLAGVDGQVVLDGSKDELDLRNLGLGDASSWLKFNGTTVAQLDLNANAGRHFDLAVRKQDDDSATLGFSPTFDLSILLNFSPLASQIADLPAYLLGDTVRVSLQGDNPTVHVGDDQVRVVSGALSMTSTRTPEANINVAAGGCLFESEVEAPAHELLGAFAAGVCK